MKRLFAIILTVAILLGVFSSTVSAMMESDVSVAATATSGTTGDCYWSIEDGVLTISGNGPMADYSPTQAPWVSSKSSITKVIILYGVTRIGAWAFAHCTSLTSISIPTSVRTIGACAFAHCTSLTSISIPTSVTYIVEVAFEYCTSLTSINVSASNKYYSSEDGVLFNKTKTELITYPAGKTETNYSTMPSTVNRIGNHACCGNAHLKTFTILNSVTSIGAYAFSNCTSLTNISLPTSVTSIGKFAFQKCSSLTSVSIPDSVTSIGDGPFFSCSSLKSINVSVNNKYYSSEGGVLFNKTKTELITYPAGKTETNYSTMPSTVNRIGNYACLGNAHLKTFTILNSVTSIGERAFEYCTSLTSVSLPNSVTSIGESAFRNCTKLSKVRYAGTRKQWDEISIGTGNENLTNATLVIEPTVLYNGSWGSLKWSIYSDKTLTITGSGDMPATSAIAAIYPWAKYGHLIETVVVEDGITSVSKGAFSGLTNLKYVILGNTVATAVATVGENAFEGCTALATIVLPASVRKVGDFAFKNCTSLKNVTMHVGISSIGEGVFMGTALEQVRYSGSLLQWNEVAIEVPNVELMNAEVFCFDAVTGSTISTIGQKKLDFDVFEMYNNRYGTGIGGVLEVSCNGKNALAGKLYYQAGTREAMNFTVTVSGNTKSVQEYQVLKTRSTFKDDSVAYKRFSESSFILYPDEFEQGEKIYIRVKYTDKSYSDVVETTICIYSSADIDIDLGSLVKVDIPENIPFIGGTSIDISSDAFPINLSYSDGSFKGVIGFDWQANDNGEFDLSNWKRLKEGVDEAEKDLDEATKLLEDVISNDSSSSEVLGGLKANLCGYFEFSIGDDGQPEKWEGKVLLSLSGAVEKKWQTAVWVIPVVVTVEISSSFTVSLSLGYDYDNNKIIYLGEFSFELPKIEASCGVGIVNVADVSAYGSVTNTIKIVANEHSRYTTATLSGTIGLKASAFFWSSEWEIWGDELEYYNSSKGATSANENSAAKLTQIKQNTLNKLYNPNSYTINRATAEDGWHGEEAALSMRSGYEMVNAVTLRSGINDLSVPQLIITDDGFKMLVWVADISERATGNHSAVVYSVYNGDTSTWSEPVIVDDDGTADFMPALATDGNDIYVVWADASDFMDESVTLNESAALCEISVARYDRESGVFGASVTLTNDSCFDVNPAVTVIDGVAHVAWVSCNGTDALAMTGTNTVCYATVSDGDYSVNAYVAYEQPVIRVGIGAFGDSVAIAYPLDGDGDLTTSEDIELYVGYVDGEAVSVTSNSLLESGIRFASLGGKNVVLWYCDGEIHMYDGTDSVVIIDDVNVSAEYCYVEGGDRSAVLCNVIDGENSRLVAYTYTDGKWNAPVDVASAPGYIRKVNGYIDDAGNFNLVFVRTDASIVEGTVTENHDLCISYVAADCAFDIGTVEIDHSLVAPGTTIDLTVPVTNNGLLSVDSFVITVYDENDAVYAQSIANQTVASGETASLPFSLTLPDTISGKTDYTIIVLPNGETDIDESDNSSVFSVGYTDLSITSVATNAEFAASAVRVFIKNTSCVDTDAVLSVYRSGEEDVALWSCYLEDIKNGEEIEYEIFSDTVRSFANDGDILLFKLTAVAEEKELYDNEDTTVVSIDLRTWLAVDDDIYAELDFSGVPYIGGKISIVTDNIDCADPTVEYVWYRDGVVIAGATEAEYTLTSTDYGHEIRGSVRGVGDYAGELVTVVIPIEESQNLNDGIIKFLPGAQVAEDVEGSAEVLRFSSDSDMLQIGEYISTGLSVTVYDANNEIIKTLTAVVMGDNDCDGMLSSTDVLRLKTHIKAIDEVDDINRFASDMNEDGVVSSIDYILMKLQLVEQ